MWKVGEMWSIDVQTNMTILQKSQTLYEQREVGRPTYRQTNERITEPTKKKSVQNTPQHKVRKKRGNV